MVELLVASKLFSENEDVLLPSNIVTSTDLHLGGGGGTVANKCSGGGAGGSHRNNTMAHHCMGIWSLQPRNVKLDVHFLNLMHFWLNMYCRPNIV